MSLLFNHQNTFHKIYLQKASQLPKNDFSIHNADWVASKVNVMVQYLPALILSCFFQATDRHMLECEQQMRIVRAIRVVMQTNK